MPFSIIDIQLAADACAAELARMEKEAEQKPRSARGPMGMGLMGPMGDDGYMPSMYEEETDEGPGSYGGAPMMPYGPMGPGDMYGDMYGQRQEEEEEDDTLNNRRRLKAFINAAFLGLSGMQWTEWTDWVRANPEGLLPSGGAAGVTAPTQGEFVKELITKVDELSKLCDNKDKLDREAFTTELETQLGALTESLGAAAGPPVGPAQAQPAGPAPPPGTAPPSAPSTTTGQPPGNP